VTSTSRHLDHPPAVILGMHANDTLNVYMRTEQGELHQAARIMTHNGVDPAAMTAVMADLSATFGWPSLVATPTGTSTTPQALPQARTAAAVRAVGTHEAEPPSNHPAGKKRRGRPRGQTIHPLTIEDIIEYVNEHPDGVRAKEIADALMPGHPMNRHTVSNRLIAYKQRCAKTGETSKLMFITDGLKSIIYPRTS
jgi:hypothetical protein